MTDDDTDDDDTEKKRDRDRDLRPADLALERTLRRRQQRGEPIEDKLAWVRGRQEPPTEPDIV